MTRSRTKKRGWKLITLYFPEEVLPLIADAVRESDSDRSKFIRRAVREKLERMGVLVGAGDSN